ncbi:class I SAM-dependent methyltransferase [Novosphingopyxis sp.]|uniref:class I SAM-dependent methyltransferase n=1 Tax=Novosphingopyxis sp. TaxID=2709690 RepID=UPI003B599670
MPEGEALAERLRRQIAASGPISVAEYMRRSNAAYYAAGDPFGANGDFVTAPEISQMFGELIGLWMADLWLRARRPEGCQYVELGPGRGTLAADILRSTATFGFAPSVHLVETSEALRDMQSQALPQARFHDEIASLPDGGPLLIVANEFFDALPVRQMIATAEGWRERVIDNGPDGGFFASAGPRDADALVPGAVRAAPEGSIIEQCPDGAAILFELLRRIAAQGGALLVIDYGYDAVGVGETLQAVKAHRPVSMFEAPGTADLTAHVDFRELANIARAADMAVHGPIGQGDWLRALGIELRAQTLGRQRPEKRIEIEVARDRLISPVKMGELFKVLAITAPAWPMPEGFGG